MFGLLKSTVTLFIYTVLNLPIADDNCIEELWRVEFPPLQILHLHLPLATCVVINTTNLRHSFVELVK